MSAGRSVPKPRANRPPEDGCAALVGGAPDLGGPRDTSRLVGILDRAPIPRADAFLAVAGPFPVAGPSRWSNDWHVRRCEPYPHLHEGIDVFAPHGTPVVAAVDGRISQRVDGDISGLAIELRGEDGVQYFYAHLSSIAPGIAPGHAVEAGTVLGAIGTTGNARGTSPHLHFEIQPNGIPVPPKPYLDRWLAVAERRSQTFLRTLRRSSDAGGRVVVGHERTAARPEPGHVSSGLPSSTAGPTGGSLAAGTSGSFVVAAAAVLVALGVLLWAARSLKRTHPATLVAEEPVAASTSKRRPGPRRRIKRGQQGTRRPIEVSVGVLLILVLAALAGRLIRPASR